jgi:predicted metal-binding membrane protein
MILTYARVARQSALDGKPLAATGWFVGGYLLAWTAFSLVAAFAQGILERLSVLTPMMATSSNRAGGVVLIVAGVFECTRMKNACLKQCQSPFAFIQSHGGFRRGIASPLKMGIRHGFYCVACCWALMALLFAGGVMNIVWIAAISIHVLIEKVLHAGSAISRVVGVALIAGGVWLFFK